jgi:cobalt-zinc-cadmium efflux system membrane fusion protein
MSAISKVSPASGGSRSWGSTAMRVLPNLFAFGLLGGVLYVGHETGWKVPKASELMRATSVSSADWCEEHLVPESECVECDVSLLPKGKAFGFCQEHGVMECVFHHPELAQVKGVPKLPSYDTVAAINLLPRLTNNSREKLHTRRVQFTNAEAVSKAGVNVSVVAERPIVESISANAELVFDPTRVAHLSARAAGSVAVVYKTIGDEVQPGDILALIDAAQVGQAKTQLVTAMVQLQLRKRTVERLKPIAAGDAVPQKAVVEAESAMQEAEVSLLSARQSLENLGFEVGEMLEGVEPAKAAELLKYVGIPKEMAGALPQGAKTANLIPLRAPYQGVIVDAEISAGEMVDGSRNLFTIADPRRMWMLLNVRQEDAPHVRRGMTVQFQTDDRNQSAEGKISWISPAIDQHTRSLQVRVALDSTDSGLRDKTFGSGAILLRDEPKAIVVPKSAVQSTSDAHFVFVRDKNFFEKDSPKFFHVRQVRIGATDGENVELLAGVLPGEVVATTGSNVLLAHLLRSDLGAGCGCHDH